MICCQSEREGHRCVVSSTSRHRLVKVTSPSRPFNRRSAADSERETEGRRSSQHSRHVHRLCCMCRRRDVKGPMVEACTSRVLPVIQLQFYHNLHTLTNQRLENTRMTSVTTDGSDELMRSYGTSAMLLALGLALRRNWEQRKYRKWCVASQTIEFQTAVNQPTDNCNSTKPSNTD